jgi:hypothetical protein
LLVIPAGANDKAPGYMLYRLSDEGRLVYIDLGSKDNVRPSNMLQLLRHESIIHPVTLEDLGGETPLGAVRVVEVFPRLSTAEVIDLVRGIDLGILDQEARAGKIRVRPMPEGTSEALIDRLKEAPEMPPLQAVKIVSADGRIGGWVPNLQVGIGTQVMTAAPDSIYKLLSASRRTLADTTVNAPVGDLNSKRQIGLSFLMPVSERLSALADIQLGGVSLLTVGGRYFMGKSFWGAGRNPDGKVGEPALTLKVGRGGRGSSSLPNEAINLIKAREDDAFLATLNPEFVGETLSDSLQALKIDTLSVITNSLRTAAEDSLGTFNNKGLGYALGLSVPVTRRFTLRSGLMKFGNISEFTGGVTYYLKASDPREEGVNPDGAIKSLVLALDGSYDTEAKDTFFNLDIKYPLGHRYTVGANLLTDMGGYNRFGLSLKGFFSGQ